MALTFLTSEDEKGFVKSINGIEPDPETGDVEITIPDPGGNVDLTGVVKSVNGVTPDENGNVEIAVSGGGGLSATASALLIGILRNAMYTADQSANITALEAALASGDSGGTYYTIVNVLTDVTNSNNASSVTKGESYTATLTPADGYNLDTVTVTMGGVDVTDDVYADGVVTIPSVTGNVIITATAKEDDATAPAFELTSALVCGDTTDPRINDTDNCRIATGETVNDDEDWTVCIDFTSLAGGPIDCKLWGNDRQIGVTHLTTNWQPVAHGTAYATLANDYSGGKLAGDKHFVAIVTHVANSNTWTCYGTAEGSKTMETISLASVGQVVVGNSGACGTIHRFAIYKRVLSADEITEWIGG